jgi:acyl-CoA thioesterase-1
MKYVLGGIAILVLLFFMFGNSNNVTDLPRKAGPIVAYGDSLVSGVGTTPGNTFVNELSRRIGEDIVNLGEAGNTTADGLMRIRELEALEPRLVIILLGGNDSLRRIDPKDTFANLNTLIETLHAKNTAVLLIGITGGFSYGTQYENEFEELAERHGVAYVPNILKGLMGHTEFMADAIHPNDEGHKRMADKIEPVLRELLEAEKK